MALDVNKIRADFPILSTRVHNRPLVYLDSAATALKPKIVADRVYTHYLLETSNVHRGLHYLSDQATSAFEAARHKIQTFLGADENEIVLTHGTTEAINIVAIGFANTFLKADDEILITELEHHSNIVPWQINAKRVGAKVKFIPVNSEGELDLTKLDMLLTKKTKLVAVTALSNTLGSKIPVKKITQACHAKNIPVLVDAAQAVANMKVDVKDWDCDFLAFSGHKLFGPTGVGVLFGKNEWLNKLPPLFGGGAMIEKVTCEGSTFLDAPFRFEAGTPDIASVIGLGTAIDYVNKIGFSDIEEHEQMILAYATARLAEIKKLTILGSAPNKGPIISFTIEGVHPQDVASIIDREGVAIRTGHHCTQPLLARLGITSTMRASFSIYSTKEDVDVLCQSLDKAIYMLG